MSAHLEELRKQYPGQLILNPAQTAKALGGKARKTVYNQVSDGVFPVRVISTGKSGWGCSIIDLALYLDTGIPYTLPEEEKAPKRGPKPKPWLVLQEFWIGVVVLLHQQEAIEERIELERSLTKPLPSKPIKQL